MNCVETSIVCPIHPLQPYNIQLYCFWSSRCKVYSSKYCAEKLNISNDFVDTLTISFGLRNVGDRFKALREFHRVLKPSGQLLVLEFFAPKSKIGSSFFNFYLQKILPFVGGVFSNKSAYSYLPKSIASFESPARLRKIFSECGFKVLRERNFLFGMTKIMVCQKV